MVAEELNGAAALLGGGALVEAGAFAVFAESGDDAVGGEHGALEADKARAIPEEPAAGPPLGGFGGEGGLPIPPIA